MLSQPFFYAPLHCLVNGAEPIKMFEAVVHRELTAIQLQLDNARCYRIRVGLVQETLSDLPYHSIMVVSANNKIGTNGRLAT